jgi:hypothetical protein
MTIIKSLFAHCRPGGLDLRLKLAPFCIGGNSIAVIASFSTCC